MERIGVRELRQNASRYLAQVKTGQTVEVTERGRLIALLVPPNPDHGARDRLVAEGLLVPATAPFRLPVPTPTRESTQGVLDALREDR